jgi:acetyl esterase/lipase
MYPVHNQDVAAAISWLLNNTASFNGNPQKLVVMGHSAGASIVSAVCVDTTRYVVQASGGIDFFKSGAIKGAIILDTDGFNITEKVLEGTKIYVDAFGTDPASNYDVSPINNIAAGKGIPSFLVNTQGGDSRKQNSIAFVNALNNIGVNASVHFADGYNHEEVNDAVGESGDTLVTPPISRFLNSLIHV